MPAFTFAAIVERQIRLLSQVCETLTGRALAGQRGDLESLFLAQGHLEQWLQYMSPLAADDAAAGLDAPAPLAGMRRAPPLPHEQEEDIYGSAREGRAEEDGLDALRPRVSFPPEPLWVDDLEREKGEDER